MRSPFQQFRRPSEQRKYRPSAEIMRKGDSNLKLQLQFRYDSEAIGDSEPNMSNFSFPSDYSLGRRYTRKYVFINLTFFIQFLITFRSMTTDGFNILKKVKNYNPYDFRKPEFPLT